jgi:hypothetical protein
MPRMIIEKKNILFASKAVPKSTGFWNKPVFYAKNVMNQPFLEFERSLLNIKFGKINRKDTKMYFSFPLATQRYFCKAPPFTLS